MSHYLIGTRIRLIGSGVRSGIRGKIATIVTPSDVQISWPHATPDITIRMDEIGEESLYWTFNTDPEDCEFIEGPARPVRCSIKKKELVAHTDAIKRLVCSAKSGSDDVDWKEKLRNADAALDKVEGMLRLPGCTPRGMCKE